MQRTIKNLPHLRTRARQAQYNPIVVVPIHLTPRVFSLKVLGIRVD